MGMTGFFCQDKYLEKTSRLSDEQLGRLFRALMTYHKTGEIVSLDIREEMAFDFIKEDIDSDEKAYQKKCDQARKNRLNGIEPASTDDNGRQPASTDDNGSKQYNIKKNKDNKKEKENIVPLKRFIPPTVDEVALYCFERHNHVNAQKFVDYYSSNGWKVGKNPMKDWKAAVRTWESSEFTEKDYQYEKETSGLPY